MLIQQILGETPYRFNRDGSNMYEEHFFTKGQICIKSIQGQYNNNKKTDQGLGPKGNSNKKKNKQKII